MYITQYEKGKQSKLFLFDENGNVWTVRYLFNSNCDLIFKCYELQKKLLNQKNIVFSLR